MSEVQQHAGRSPGTASASGNASCAATRYSSRGTRRGAVSALATAAVAIPLASSCCLVPLLLVSVGFSGAWLGNLRTLQPYSPILTGIAVVALAFAGQSLRRPTSCHVGSARSRSLFRASFWLIAVLTLTLLITPLVAPWFY